VSRGSRLWQLLAGGVALVGVLVLVGALLFANHRSSPSRDSDEQAGAETTEGSESHSEDADHDSGGFAESLKEHPSLGKRQLPLAFVNEKLEQSGGEASGEVNNGPSQEEYDQRAYPHVYIRPERQRAAAQAYVQAKARAQTPAGRRQLGEAFGAAKVRSWAPLGPHGGLQVPEATYTGTPAIVSGRTTSLAMSRRCQKTSCVLYAGTAGGGVWKTTDALAARPHWVPIGSDIPSTAIGVVYLAPNGDLYVGTGEPNGSGDSEAGVGLFKSSNGGHSFVRVRTRAYGSDFATDRGIASVAVDPHNSKHMYVGTTVARHGSSSVNGGRFTPPASPQIGLYESVDGGRTWHLSLSRPADAVDPSTATGNDYFRGGVSKILFDPTHPRVVYASMFDYGLFRRVGSHPWMQIYTIKTPGDPATSSFNRVEFALAPLGNGNTRVYVGDATYFTVSAGVYAAALLRSDDATAHAPTWRLLSHPKDGTPGYGSYNFCETFCTYDMFVASPLGHPNQVFLGGSMNYDELLAFGGPGNSNGRAVIRSTDGGRHFTDMTNDAQRHSNGLHPDQHGFAFVPHSAGKVFFTGSDGGVWRQSGPFVDVTDQCVQRGLSGALLQDCQQFLSAIPTRNTSLNRGLETLQYQSLSVAGNGRVIQGGTQDNGTWESDTPRGWAETIGGDGGQSGFDAGKPNIRYHAYFDPQHDVNFESGDPTDWDSISDPLLASGEGASFYVPFTADPVIAGTAFDGLQHIWRTTDHGGQRAYLDKHCNELTGDFSKPCGDWVPLGGHKGDLSSAAWGANGADPANYVVAVERASSNTSTMWAATRYGRLFISGNANAKNPDAVNYHRLDLKLGLPQRFVSGIQIDPKNPHHAFISYSGYSAYSPGGHVYEVTWHPKTQTGTARNLSFDLGDQPVTDIVYSASHKSWFISTDFGVLTRAKGERKWVATPGLPRVAVYGLTLARHGQQVLAATHGRSVWKLDLR
jgi:hypothetical protein